MSFNFISYSIKLLKFVICLTINPAPQECKKKNMLNSVSLTRPKIMAKGDQVVSQFL